MAHKMILVDDLDGTELREAGETVTFSIDGTAYEVDLSTDNAAKLRDSFGQWVGIARKAGRVGRPDGESRSARRGSSGRTAIDREQAAAIREWAVANGHMTEGSRGRIPQRVSELWQQAHRPSQPTLPNSDARPKFSEPAKSTAKAGKASAPKAEGKDTEKVPQPA